MPISVHLDHATDEEQLELAVGLAEKGIAFDSIMVDASHADVSNRSSQGVRAWSRLTRSRPTRRTSRSPFPGSSDV